MNGNLFWVSVFGGDCKTAGNELGNYLMPLLRPVHVVRMVITLVRGEIEKGPQVVAFDAKTGRQI
ncbi:hypothetical protein N9980_01945 [bacterium]|nr:hypothetical protein [bacterium]